MSEMKPVVSILMGSRSDLPTMENCFNQLKEFGIPFEAHALSAHRTPNEVIKLAEGAKDRGIKVIIAAAGGAAHLGGVIASSTTLPVIGVPIQTSALGVWTPCCQRYRCLAEFRLLPLRLEKQAQKMPQFWQHRCLH